MRAGKGPWREMVSPAQKQEDEWLLPSTPAALYRYHLLGETLPSLKSQPFPILPIPFSCFIFLLSTYISQTIHFAHLSFPLLGYKVHKDKDFLFYSRL